MFLITCILLTVILLPAGCDDTEVPLPKREEDPKNPDSGNGDGNQDNHEENNENENNPPEPEPYAEALRVLLKKETSESNYHLLTVESLATDNISRFDYFYYRWGGVMGSCPGTALICKLIKTDVSSVNETIEKLNALDFVDRVELGDENDAGYGTITTEISQRFDLSYPKEISEIDFDVIYFPVRPILITTKPIIDDQEPLIKDFPIPNINYVDAFGRVGQGGVSFIISIGLIDSSLEQIKNTVNELNKIDFIKSVSLNEAMYPC